MNFFHSKQNHRVLDSLRNVAPKNPTSGQEVDARVFYLVVFILAAVRLLCMALFSILVFLRTFHLRSWNISSRNLGYRVTIAYKVQMVLPLSSAPSFPNQHQCSLSKTLSTAVSFHIPKSISCHPSLCPVGSAWRLLIRNR